MDVAHASHGEPPLAEQFRGRLSIASVGTFSTRLTPRSRRTSVTGVDSSLEADGGQAGHTLGGKP
jgi:hypothetical protein